MRSSVALLIILLSYSTIFGQTYIYDKVLNEQGKTVERLISDQDTIMIGPSINLNRSLKKQEIFWSGGKLAMLTSDKDLVFMNETLDTLFVQTKTNRIKLTRTGKNSWEYDNQIGISWDKDRNSMKVVQNNDVPFTSRVLAIHGVLQARKRRTGFLIATPAVAFFGILSVYLASRDFGGD